MAIGVAMLLLGCSTPESRIKKNPELFASFPADAQETIRRGEVAIGFTTEMVAMALGKPDRIYSRETAGLLLEVWAYTSSYTTTDRERIRVDVKTRDHRGRAVSSSQWVYVDVPKDTEYDRVRIEFSDGKVMAIDRLQR